MTIKIPQTVEKQTNVERETSKEEPEHVVINGGNWYIFMEIIELAMIEGREATIH